MQRPLKWLAALLGLKKKVTLEEAVEQDPDGAMAAYTNHCVSMGLASWTSGASGLWDPPKYCECEQSIELFETEECYPTGKCLKCRRWAR
jgi:hypothetical protein